MKALAKESKQVFTILHVNDTHSNVIGVGPSSDYTPMTLNDDATKGGFSRLAALVAQRRQEMEQLGPVLVLDDGDFSMGTAIGAATRELGAELQLLARMGFEATTLGNHDFDFGPDGLGSAIGKAAAAGLVPPIIASNIDVSANEPRLAALKKLVEKQVIRPYMVIERGGLRFGILGLIGYDAYKYTTNPGGVVFPDPIESAKKTAKLLRNQEYRSAT